MRKPKIFFLFSFIFLSSLLFSQIDSVYAHTYSSLIEALKNPDDVLGLNLTNQGLTSLPEEIGVFKNLISLQANFNHLKTVPESIGKLTKLKELYLNGNSIETLPNSIGNLKNLSLLCLDYNRLTALPDGILQINKMTYFTIGNNPLKIWPKQIGSMNYSYSDTVFDVKKSKMAFLGTAQGVYLAADSFYLQRYAVFVKDISTGKITKLVESTGPQNDPQNSLYNFCSLQFSPDANYIYFECKDAWEKSDALHRVEIATRKENFVSDVIGDYHFITQGEFAGNIFCVRYHYDGEGTGSLFYLLSPTGKEIKAMDYGEEEKMEHEGKFK